MGQATKGVNSFPMAPVDIPMKPQLHGKETISKGLPFTIKGLTIGKTLAFIFISDRALLTIISSPGFIPNLPAKVGDMVANCSGINSTSMGLFLVLTRVANWRVPLAYLGSVALLSWVGNLALPDMEKRYRKLPLIHLILIGLEAALLALLLFTAISDGGTAAQSAQNILSGSPKLIFWILIVLLGLALPFIYHAYTLARGRHSRFLDLASGLGILIAGLVLRYLVLVSGIFVAL